MQQQRAAICQRRYVPVALEMQLRVRCCAGAAAKTEDEDDERRYDETDTPRR